MYRDGFDPEEVLRVAARVPQAVLRSEVALRYSLTAICDVEDPIREQDQSLTDLNHLALAAPLAQLLQADAPGLRGILADHGKGPANVRLVILLLLMSPGDSDPETLEALSARGARLGWMADVARAPSDHPELMQLLRRAKGKLLALRVPGADLRAPRHVPVEELEAFQAEMRQIYRDQGQEKARAFLERARADQSTALGRYLAANRPSARSLLP